MFEAGFNFVTHSIFLLDRMKLPEFVQKFRAINCHRLRILHGCMLDTMLHRRNGVRQKHSDLFLGLSVVGLEVMIAFIWAKRDNHLQLLDCWAIENRCWLSLSSGKVDSFFCFLSCPCKPILHGELVPTSATWRWVSYIYTYFYLSLRITWRYCWCTSHWSFI